eukprot:scaffold1596_cov302-Pinguiococcus_pyrenoidosus.AAC.42
MPTESARHRESMAKRRGGWGGGDLWRAGAQQRGSDADRRPLSHAGQAPRRHPGGQEEGGDPEDAQAAVLQGLSHRDSGLGARQVPRRGA